MLRLPPAAPEALYRLPRFRHPNNVQIQRTTHKMALTDSNVLKLTPDAGTPVYRSAPHNIEAEQSLLGAIARVSRTVASLLEHRCWVR